MIRAHSLSKRFGPIQAVDGVSFEVRRGEIAALLGPNGAGKTTTLRLLTGFLRPDAGRVLLAGFDLLQQPIAARRVFGYLPEGAPLYGEMTVAAFLQFIARMRGQPRLQIERVVELLELKGVLSQKIETLSKGFRRRVGLAQAILHQPEVLILDEPTDGLDPNQKLKVRDLLVRLREGAAILLSTHLLEEIPLLASRVLLMSRGRLLFDGSPAEFLKRSRYCGALTLRLKSPLLIEGLSRLPGVVRVERDPFQPLRFTLLPGPGVDLISSLAPWLQEHRREIDSVSVEEGRFEEVFSRLTREEAP